MTLQPPSVDFVSAGDPADPRLGDLIISGSSDETKVPRLGLALIGFPDDRGIVANRGRSGAKEGPRAIRSHLYKLVPPSLDIRVADWGDLQLTEDLIADHRAGEDAVAKALESASRVAILGGGHDWGFCPLGALLRVGRAGFINFDAHLDVREDHGENSGTSYRRAMEAGVRGEDAFWVGVQPSATAREHLAYVRSKGGVVAMADGKLPARRVVKAMMAGLAERCDAIDLSVDMDVFAASESPGVSAPQPAGLRVAEVLPLLREILAHEKVRTFGVYETSPPNDPLGFTARLAARCVWEALSALSP